MAKRELRETVADTQKLAEAVAQMRRRLASSSADPPSTGSESDVQQRLERAHANWEFTLEELETAREELVAQNERLVDTTFELAEQRRRYSDLFALAPLPMVVTDARERVAELNDAATKLFEDNAMEPGEAWLPRIADADRDRVRELLQTPWSRGESARRLEVELVVSEDGSSRHVGLSVAPARRNGSASQLVWIIEDLQARRQAETLSERDRSNDEFLATLGHELRAPLAAMRVGIDVLSRRREDVPDSAEALEVLQVQLRQITRMVDDIVDRRRGVDGVPVLRREPTDLRDLLRAQVASVRSEARRRNQTLSIQLPPEALLAEVDPVRVGQALLNLLSNAAKCTPDYGSIFVRATVEDDEIVIAIRDTGVGMTPERIAAILSDEAPNTLAEAPASALGLPLARRMIERHDGRLGIESLPEPGDSGTQVEVRLPRLDPDEQAARAASEAEQRRRRILLVEDDPELAELVATLLERGGHEVEHAADGEDALTVCHRFTPDLVICDVGLPGQLDGHGVVEFVRGLHPHARVVAATGHTLDPASADRFDDYLLKPYGMRDLERILAALTDET